MATYKWASGSRFRGNAQEVGERLNYLQKENAGRLTPRVVLEDARPSDSPLHPCFEWSDLRAAELYREDQARKVITHIRVVMKEGERQEPVRAFVHVIEQVGDDTQSGYVPVARIHAEPELRRQVLAQARADLASMQQRYKEFSTLDKIFGHAVAEIDSLFVGGEEQVAQ